MARCGGFCLAVVCRNFDFGQYMTWPRPTRVFGIGTHKTGTTSLHHAFQLLGYDSAHWTGPGWAKRIWNEMKEAGRSVTLERHLALCDEPFGLLFRELDRAYPGSKFILTTRDEDRWLQSVRNHWSPINPWRKTWDEDFFTHRMHQLMYGQRSFEPETMLARYRAHNRAVRAHFKDRPDDLLEMNMERGFNWGPLCAFLNKPVPAVDYPRAFVTKGAR